MHSSHLLRRAALAVLLALTTSSLAAQPAAHHAPAPLTPAARRAALDSAAALLHARYPDAAIGRLLADSLRHWAQRDAFANFTPERFADSLGSAMRAIVPDRHLYLRYLPGVESETSQPGATRTPLSATGPGAPGGGGQPTRRMAGPGFQDPAALAAMNYGFVTVQRLDGNVGYVRIDMFAMGERATAAADQALAMVRDADAVIVDLRATPGGAPSMVQYVLSHFIAGPPQLLHASYSRADQRSDSLWSLPELGRRGLGGKPLFVLTSRRSGSAAELFPYIVKRLGLGTVIGETTAGAGQGGARSPLGGGLHLFVPQRQILTGPGWEGTGVTPDLAVPADEALERALAMAHERRREAAAPTRVFRP